MYNLCGIDHIPGSYDKCLTCDFLGAGCSGPWTNGMAADRYISWLKALRNRRKAEGRDVSSQAIADAKGLSKSTVDDIFAGRRKDISRTTAGLIEGYLIGDDTKWPCAMELNKDKNIVYQDRPDTLSALQERTTQVENLRRHLDEFKAVMDKEVATVRAEYEDDINSLEEDVKFLKEQIAFYREQIARKDKYIDVLMEKRSGDK